MQRRSRDRTDKYVAEIRGDHFADSALTLGLCNDIVLFRSRTFQLIHLYA